MVAIVYRNSYKLKIGVTALKVRAKERLELEDRTVINLYLKKYCPGLSLEDYQIDDIRRVIFYLVFHRDPAGKLHI